MRSQVFLRPLFFMFGLFMYLLSADENSMQVLYVPEELFSQLTSRFHGRGAFPWVCVRVGGNVGLTAGNAQGKRILKTFKMYGI